MHEPTVAEVPAKDAKDKGKPAYTDDHPEFPKLLYNHKTRATKAAKDKEEEQKLAKDGFVEDSLPAEDPDQLTPEEVQQLESLLKKAAKALAKLGKLQPNENDKPAEKPAAPVKK